MEDSVLKQATSNQIEFDDYLDELGVETIRGMHVEHCFSRHTHRSCCIGIVRHGAWELSCRGQSHEIRPGQVFVIPPGVEHSCQNIGDEILAYWTMVVSPSIFSATGLEYTDAGSLRCLLTQIVIDDSRLYKQIVDLQYLLTGNETSLAKQSAILSILGYIIAQYTSGTFVTDTNKQPGNHENRIRQVQMYIDEHYPESITLQCLAEIASTSPYHLLRLFSEIVGIPPHLYQQQIRIRSAKQLLADGEGIANTANATGFVDQSHFTRTFKKMVGITPKQYQKQQICFDKNCGSSDI